MKTENCAGHDAGLAARVARLLLVAAFALAAPALGAELQLATAQANLRAGPGAQHAITTVLKRGEKLQPLAWEDGYVKARRAASGEEGWVYGAAQGWTESTVRAALAARAPRRAEASAAAPAAAPAPPTAVARQDGTAVHDISLARMGYTRGHHFEGAQAVHAHTFVFALPREGTTGDARLLLAYRAALPTVGRSTLRVDVNDRPLRLVALSGETADTLELAIPRSELAGRSSLRVTVRGAILASENRCLDERQLPLYFIDILPETRLSMTRAGSHDALRAAWATLPSTVSLSVPAPLDEASAQSALQLAGLLQRGGRQVRFVALPEIGDVVAAGQAQLAQAMTAATGWRVREGASGNALLLQGPHTAIAITEPAAVGLFGLEPPDWHGLLRAAGYGAAAGARTPAAEEWLALEALGADTSTRYMAGTAEWSLHLAPPRVPGNTRLRTVRVNLVAAPEPEERHSLLYFYLNGVLQEIRTLDNDGRPHTHSFAVPEDGQRVGDNSLRLVLQRVGEDAGDCRGPAHSVAAQLLPDSAVRVEKFDRAPQQFSDLAATFASGYDLYLTQSAAARAPESLGLLAAVLATPGMSVERASVRLLADNAAFAPQRPFLLMGRPAGGPEEAPVRFDRGRVRVVDARAQVLLDIDRLPLVSIAQLARQGGQHGLWIAPAESRLPSDPARVALSLDDVAFIDDEGIVMTMESKYRTLAHVEYPDYLSWFDLLGRYRFWLIALGWTALVILLVFLYRKAREHRG